MFMAVIGRSLDPGVLASVVVEMLRDLSICNVDTFGEYFKGPDDTQFRDFPQPCVKNTP